MIAVVDYGRGNLFSLCQALRHFGADYQIVSEAGAIAAADRVILPGVGAFGDAAAALHERGLADVLRDIGRRGTPLLGICLGMQLLLDESDEFGSHQGLGLIPGPVRRLPDPIEGSAEMVRIPNVGWRRLEATPGGFLDNLAPRSMVYFVHSYAAHPSDPSHIAATVPVNGLAATAVVHHRNLLGYQFHPEKSGELGLHLIRRFLDIPLAPSA